MEEDGGRGDDSGDSGWLMNVLNPGTVTEQGDEGPGPNDSGGWVDSVTAVPHHVRDRSCLVSRDLVRDHVIHPLV